MTISEAIDELRSRKVTMSMCIDIESCRNANNAIDMSIQAIQENDKLKAEIEQLKEDCKDEMSMANEYTEIMVNQRKEIERLKSELEQSIKLPCKVGDIVYREIIQHDSYDDSEYKVISACNFRFDMIDKIGKTVFLSREEAEQTLKGKE